MENQFAGNLRLSLLIILVLALIVSATAQTSSKRPPVVSIKPSNVLREVSERAKQQPSLTPAELAAYGNDLIARKGFGYDFNICDVLHTKPTQTSPADFVRPYQMTLSRGVKRTFELRIGNPNADSALCGECWSEIPSVQVRKKELTLIAEGKRYRVRRPPSFNLDEVELVDETLKNVLRTWQLPYQTIPAGISADGTKLYLDFYTDFKLEQLVLEISENGPPQFRERAVIKSSEGKTIENHPKDPRNAYLSFMSFNVGEKTYRIKFSGPCT